MANDVLIVAEHLGGKLDDTTFEMLGLGKKLAQQTGGSTLVALIGGDDSMVSELGAADTVVRVAGSEVADFNPETYSAALKGIVRMGKGDEQTKGPLVIGAGQIMDLSNGFESNFVIEVELDRSLVDA